ncbi:MAG TPA: hypothetical protein VHC00_13020 [Rhizobiaceae bacterium]|nr:hypothetical protein [Rhizobiaceae bacterium]
MRRVLSDAALGVGAAQKVVQRGWLALMEGSLLIRPRRRGRNVMLGRFFLALLRQLPFLGKVMSRNATRSGAQDGVVMGIVSRNSASNRAGNAANGMSL